MKSDIEILAEVTGYSAYSLKNTGYIKTSDALTALATLRSQMQGSKWISVEDRLPEDYEENHEYLIAINGIVSRYLCRYNSRNNTWIRQDTFNDVMHNITHWQPLPEPPAPLTKY